MWSDVSRSRDVLGSTVHWWRVISGPGRKADSSISYPNSRTGHPFPLACLPVCSSPDFVPACPSRCLTSSLTLPQPEQTWLLSTPPSAAWTKVGSRSLDHGVCPSVGPHPRPELQSHSVGGAVSPLQALGDRTVFLPLPASGGPRCSLLLVASLTSLPLSSHSLLGVFSVSLL